MIRRKIPDNKFIHWQDGRSSQYLYFGNAVIAMKSMEQNEYDFVLADPPYGIKQDARHRKVSNVKQASGNVLKVVSAKGQNSRWDEKPAGAAFFNQVFRVGRKQIIFGEPYLKFKEKGSSSGRIIWDKLVPHKDRSEAEIMWTNIITKTKVIRYMWSGFQQGKSLADPYTPKGDKSQNEKVIHPTQKPVLLYKKLLLDYCFPGCTVLDPGFGSANLAIACHQLGINYVGYEADRVHFWDGVDNVSEYFKLKEIQPELNFIY